MKNFLRDIISLKKREIEALKIKRPITDFVNSKRLLKGLRPFRESISTKGRVNLIAEIKNNSPSRKKAFFRKLDVARLADIYAKSGAKAISVLTDESFFGGDILHISEVRSTVNLPVLRKDFIIDEYQVYESRYFGADAILLIARILTKDEIRSFMHFAKRIGMDSVVEIHNEKDLEKALLADAKIIGINNRNLDTFEVNVDNTFKLASKMPNQIIKISESGIKTNEHILGLRNAGVNAVLIGEAFLEAKDIDHRIKEIMGAS
ncbi:MAG: indole-3-glycerol phosphate synthase TrpC [Candidatus Omnitrophica bacterium]|nr:indole-3-glycerol phosphate synthase TrpC [Candidatus Omnitrophota bacterium]MBU1853413.1 indole-3-glycerol phosphate synthase TrpC [Candidatus Omnitrophota bacterium]